MTDITSPSMRSIPPAPMERETEHRIGAALALFFGPTAIVVAIILLAMFFASSAAPLLP